jgi:hypothetical protein
MLLIAVVVPLRAFVTCAFVLLLKETQSLVVKAFAPERSKAFWADSLPGSQAQDLLQHQLRSLLVTFQWHHGAQEFRLLCRPSRMRVSLPSTLLAARKQANAG